MHSSIAALRPLFEAERAAGRSAVLAVVVRTDGSTYSKPGGLMLIAQDGRYAGLLSGGCLEGDLGVHARTVLDACEPRIVSYDMRGPDDQLFGLGAGCEGAMQIMLLPLSAASAWRPLDFFVRQASSGEPAAAAIVVESREPALPLGAIVQSEDPPLGPPGTPAYQRLLAATRESAASGNVQWFAGTDCAAFIAVLSRPPRLLVLGGGPDALPVVELASFMGWPTTVVDHRRAYASAERFPRSRVLCARPEELAGALALGEFAAAVVMSHHLPTDLGWLRMLARTPISYVGLLGPAARRERLLSELGAEGAALQARLRAPVGLDIGGRSPESIALSIVAEIHAALEGRDGRPFSQTVAIE